jgi:hypothetical protein
MYTKPITNQYTAMKSIKYDRFFFMDKEQQHSPLLLELTIIWTTSLKIFYLLIWHAMGLPIAQCVMATIFGSSFHGTIECCWERMKLSQ